MEAFAKLTVRDGYAGKTTTLYAFLVDGRGLVFSPSKTCESFYFSPCKSDKFRSTRDAFIWIENHWPTLELISLEHAERAVQ